MVGVLWGPGSFLFCYDILSKVSIYSTLQRSCRAELSCEVRKANRVLRRVGALIRLAASAEMSANSGLVEGRVTANTEKRGTSNRRDNGLWY